MVSDRKAYREFLDNIPDEKLHNFASRQYTIKKDTAAGFRLDHQGKNQDGSGKDRLFIQPLGIRAGGKSNASQQPPGKVLARVHLTDPTNPKEVREALFRSATSKAKLIDLP